LGRAIRIELTLVEIVLRCIKHLLYTLRQAE